MSIKVRGGTVKGSDSLCRSCAYAHLLVDMNGREAVHCSLISSWLTRRIAICSEYRDKSTPSRQSFEDIAWTLKTDKNRGPIGFQPPDKSRRSYIDTE